MHRSAQQAFVALFFYSLVSYMKSIPPFNADIAHAREVAKLVLAGVMTPRHGCARIAEVSTALGSPNELAVFELLNHEQYGHEHIGITLASVTPEIINACKTLAAHS